jgi:hypothetical protein
VAALDGLGHELGVLVVAANDLKNTVAAGDFVVLVMLVRLGQRDGEPTVNQL